MPMNNRAYELIRHLRAAKTHMEMSYPQMKRIALFMEMRYELLSVHWPHKTFSVGQCSDHFFEETLDYLEGRKELPKKEQHNIYQNNYIDWIIEWKKQIDA